MMSWGRENSRMSNWSSPANFHYDSADLPFSPPSGDAGYLESGLPLWKASTMTEMDNSFQHADQINSAARDQFLAPLFRVLTTHNRSNENISSFPQDQADAFATEMLRMSKSLPATPLATPVPTPYSTPSPTPYSTPAPTPQTSPCLPRKTETEAVRKTSFRRTPGLASDQPSQNMKWFYLGFMPQGGSEASKTEVSTSVNPKQIGGSFQASSVASSKIPEESALSFVPGPSSKVSTQSCRRRCAPLISNRDMNFLAPTSM